MLIMYRIIEDQKMSMGMKSLRKVVHQNHSPLSRRKRRRRRKKRKRKRKKNRNLELQVTAKEGVMTVKMRIKKKLLKKGAQGGGKKHH